MESKDHLNGCFSSVLSPTPQPFQPPSPSDFSSCPSKAPSPPLRFVAKCQLPTIWGLFNCYAYQDLSSQEKRFASTTTSLIEQSSVSNHLDKRLDNLNRAPNPLACMPDSSSTPLHPSSSTDILVFTLPQFTSQSSNQSIWTRIHDQCLTSEVFGSLRCDCQVQLFYALSQIPQQNGILIYLPQEGRGIGLANKIHCYQLQDQGFDTVQANLELGFQNDCRTYQSIPWILKHLNIQSIQLCTNNPRKIQALTQCNIQIDQILPIQSPVTSFNYHYLKTKQMKLNHDLNLNWDAKNKIHEKEMIVDDSTLLNHTKIMYQNHILNAFNQMKSNEVIQIKKSSDPLQKEISKTETNMTHVAPNVTANLSFSNPISQQVITLYQQMIQMFLTSHFSSHLHHQIYSLQSSLQPALSINSIQSYDTISYPLESSNTTSLFYIHDFLKNQKTRPKWRLGKQSVLQAIQALIAGEGIVVTDDENRENEGDLIYAAQFVSPHKMAKLIQYTSGVLCVPMESYRLNQLEIPKMVTDNQDPRQTAFHVSVDYADGSTGISAKCRSRTIQELANPTSKPSCFQKPGHVFPLAACDLGVLQRQGHTEAAVDLCKLAGLQPVAVIGEIISSENPTEMAKFEEIQIWSQKQHFVMTTIVDILCFRLESQYNFMCEST